ncbi:3-phenylpropionate dioxygenase [Rhodococcus rhodnii]|uniref:3-phenylpropionate dioxygenase n=1 Tax=Rhodococcus rhodnii TaxID=38312 RepID=A0A6P2C9Q5_9NOCA|nr:3-phenylpropionate/cinnamic acid dioxygenase subunit beta [Rhodococcus rhodnii]TXG89373.1 3-phenylpropionate dioxygenase [Rhodococcus rhodnii]
MSHASTAVRPLSVSDPRHAEATDFFHYEAELLDDLEERTWLRELVSRDIVYRVPVRETVERARGRGFAESSFHLDETYGSLDSRVTRGETRYAWAEDPPSRILHFVTNIRVRPSDDEDLLDARSNILIFRTRQDQTSAKLLSGERHDVLRREDGRWRLLRRVVLLDLTVIGTHNFSLFF